MAQESRLVIVIDSQNAERNARNLGNELVSIERKGEFASKSMDSLSVATRALAGHMAGLVTVGAAISKMDTYTGLQNRLKLVTNNQAELNKATEDTFQIAQKTYSAWDSVLQVYQRFSDNAKTLNLTMDDTARLTETVSKAVAISGASAEAADAALVQFGQALASGTLRGEELNSVMEQTPALAKAIAKGMGITVGELRSVAAEGKITSQEIVKALKNVQNDVDALFAKTDITIGQSLTLLNNEITKFVGEAGKGSGAAQVLAGSVQTLASNLDLIADGALVVGIGYITRAILMKSAAIKEGMASTLANRQASVLNAQAEYAEATAALNAAKAHLANVRATNAETQAKFGATAAATRYAQAQAAVTAATNAQTAAQIKLNTATSIAGRLAKGAFGLIGGWTGVATLGVMGLAAAYSYFNNKAEEAKQKLAEQAKVAEKADEELKKLTGNDKAKAVNDLTIAFNAQNKALEKSSRAVGSALIDIENYARGNREVEKISQEARTGTISYTEAIERLNKIKLPTDLYENLKKQAAQYDDNASKASLSAEKLKLLRVEVKLGGNEAQNAAIQHQKQADALGNTATEAEKATKALQDYQAKQKDSVIDSIYKSGWLDKGYTVAQANAILELQKAKGMSAILSKDEIDSALRNLKIIEEQQEREDKLTEAKRKQTKEAAKQAVLLAGNNEQARNMLRVYQSFRNAGLGDKQARVMTAQVGRETDFRNEAMFGSHKDANNGYNNTGFLSWQKSRSTKLMQSLQGQGVLDKNGKIQQTQDALDAMAKHAVQEAMTDKSYSKSKAALLNEDLDYRSLERIVAKNFVGWDYDGKKLGKAKASQHLAKQDSYYNQLSKILGDNPEAASKAIGDLSKFEDEAYKARAKTLEEVKQLQATYDSETVARSKKREEEINKATILGQSNLIPKINERYDAEDKLSQKQFDFEVNGYKWTEEQKLDYTYETNSLRLVAEGKLSEDQRKVALDGLKLQKQQELGLLKLAQEQRLFQARLSLLSETQAMQERYRLEREEILKNTKLSIAERQKLIALSKATQEKETRDKVNNAVQNWGGIQADMNGTSEFFRQDQERFNRLNAANDLADSQFAATDLNEQNSLDGLDAQLEAGLIKQQDYENQKTAIIQTAQDQRNQIAAEYAKNAQDIEDKYQQDRLNTQIAFGGQMMGSLTSMFGSMFGEQSKAYKIMFAADKAYAIAAAGIAIQQNIAAASKAGFPLNIPLIAGAVAQGASIIANIRAIKDQGFADGGYTGSGGKYEPAGIVHKGEVVWSQDDIRRWGGVGLVENMRKSANPEAFINNHAINNTSAENVFNRSFLSSKAFNDNQNISNIFNQPTRENQIIVNAFKSSKDAASRSGDVQSITNQYAGNNTSIENVFNRSFLSSKAFNDNKSISNISNLSNSKVLNSNVSNSTVQNAEKELLKEVSIFKDNGFADGGYTGKGKKYEIAGAVHKGEIVWSQDDIKKWGGVDKVEKMRRATSPESFVSNYAQNHTTFESILNRAHQSSRIFNQSKEISNIFNQSVQDDQIIYKGNGNVPTSATSDLYHDGKVYFSSNGLVQDRSNLEDVQDFTISQASRPQAEIMPSIEPSTPTINFKIEVINQVSGATVEAEQLDEQTVRIIVTDELDKQLPRKVPKLVSDQIGNPNSTISRSLTENTTARRNRT
ncbi:tape measure protein [Acinetobacter baumannii]|uniref:tape measure protein n=1 Tax=Acinetobacter baumannii TaxID=470 RepID=UPI00112905A2|nr:tape measure protein [Acinetobacter baumannii]MDC5050181.1 tape measure protein [Acinetobacter baumannii]MDO7393738.1 tape measure protein [Acinetobacter baumannii]MDV5699657.1 tape measure protein [Acinetobacter baumannii]QLF06044.1 tape measure protein [Acinetobacter baumannii]TPT11239.1 tape measure protein [Acinetobacter baumannii]